MDNYPIGIHQYDSDPRSPFYVEPPVCDECEGELEQDIDCDEDGYHVAASVCVNDNCAANREADEDE